MTQRDLRELPTASVVYAGRQRQMPLREIGAAPLPLALGFTASVVAGKVRVVFSRAVYTTLDLLAAVNYTITAPAGAQALTALSVALVSPTTVDLATSGETVNSAAYSLAVTANTAHATDDGGGNTGTSVTFSGSSTSPAVFTVTELNHVTIRVAFTKAVRMVSASNSDDALNLANYVAAPPLTIISVTRVSDTIVDLVTSVHASLTSYSVTVSNVKDLAGNIV